MKQFSEYLLDYVKGRNLTWTDAAKLCGINRTLLSRYASGKKLPEYEKVLKIADGLGMSGHQSKELLALYQISKEGDYQYGTLNLIEQLFEQPPLPLEFEETENLLGREWKKGRAQRLYGREAVQEAMRCLVREAEYLQIHMEADDFLPDIRCGARICHLIEVSNTGGEENEVEEFKALLPFLFAGSDYRVYCHYRCGESAGMQERLSMILSDKALLVFSEEPAYGFYTCEEKYLRYYSQIFQAGVKKSHMFAGGDCAAYQSLHMPKESMLLENQEAGISFLYQGPPYERIWVQKTTGGQEGFYVQEPQFVKMFLVFMEMQPTTGAVRKRVWDESCPDFRII